MKGPGAWRRIGRQLPVRRINMSPLEAHDMAAQLAGVANYELTAWVLVAIRDEGERSVLSISRAEDTEEVAPRLLERALAILRAEHG